MTRIKIKLGLERLLEENAKVIEGARVGLICNQASVDHGFRHAADILDEHSDVDLRALFGPQHGIRGDVQDNMIETEHSIDPQTGLPIHSLYSETREPTETMLQDLDVLIFDMQDVGCRIYTFAYTMANSMIAARKFGKKMIVCDRPNPINGMDVAGNVLEPEHASFVGQFAIPTRHGMTLGELALLFNNHFEIGCDLEVVRMEGWERELWMDQTDAPWVMPSPNIPTLDSATVFPGTVHFEGTQISEGRGTTRPFELVGAPYIDAELYAAQLNALRLPGVFFRSCIFRPTFQKHAGVSCGGVQIHVIDRDMFEPVVAGLHMVKVAYELYPEEFKWKVPPYEYVYDRNPFDVIAGTSSIREGIESGAAIEALVENWDDDLFAFQKVRAAHVLY
jgi:beta-N-acetylhexosaminidase